MQLPYQGHRGNGSSTASGVLRICKQLDLYLALEPAQACFNRSMNT